MILKNKKILVTGASGFISSHLVKRLLKEGAKVYANTKYNSVIDNLRLLNFWEDIKVVEADIRNVDSLSQLKKVKPEIIYHLAAYNHVGDSFLHVSEALHCNGIATANLLECYQDYEKFIYMSTSETYGKQTTVPFQETMTPFPISPYAVGKYSGELYARMMQHVHGLPIVVLKPFNTFGPFQSPRAVIGEMIIKCLKGEDILATEGKQTREFNYVDNIVDGLIAAGKSNEGVGEVINIASGEEITIKDLILKIHNLSDSKSKLKIGALPYRPTEIWRMSGDYTKAKKLLGWSPKVTFEEGLRRSIEWYRMFLDIFEGKESKLLNLNE